MKELRLPVATVGFIDSYSDRDRSVFGDVRNFECFKQLHVGILSELPRKTLPEIAKWVGLKDGQSLHHFLRDGIWPVEQVRGHRFHVHFHPDDQVEVHHLDGNYKNRRKENLAVTHRHCHDQIHGGKGNLSTQLSTYNKGQFGEEPDERKLSRPILKPSRVGDHPA